MLGRQCPGLELDAFEAIGINHAPGLGDDLLFVQCLAPRVGLVGRINMLGVLEEQVGTEGNFIAHRAAEQVHQGHLQVLRLQVEKRHLEG